MKTCKVLVTGGCGYVGSRLVPYLLSKGYVVTVLDSLVFGNHLEGFNFHLIEGDIRDSDAVKRALHDVDVVIHLAAISNDPTSELNPVLTKEVNYDAVLSLVRLAKENGVQRVILASSSTLYGYQGGDAFLDEDGELNPLTLYGKYKAESEERAFLLADDTFTVTAARPGTVAGFSLRQRFDLIVNILTNHAVNTGQVIVEGGSQKRPIVHIHDMCRAYEYLLAAPSYKVQREAFNIVGENMTIGQIASVVTQILPGTKTVLVDKQDDRRSYFTSGEKIKQVLGFEPKLTCVDAIKELVDKFSEEFFDDSLHNPEYFNIKKLKKLDKDGE